MFGHVLRLDENTPAQRAMDHYFKPGNRGKGRPETMLPTKLRQDLDHIGLGFQTARDLERLREIALDRNRWQKVVLECCENHRNVRVVQRRSGGQ